MRVEIIEVCEAWNPSIPDLDIEEQISEGCSDWCAVTSDGRQFYGGTEQEARDQAEQWVADAAEEEFLQRVDQRERQTIAVLCGW